MEKPPYLSQLQWTLCLCVWGGCVCVGVWVCYGCVCKCGVHICLTVHVFMSRSASSIKAFSPPFRGNRIKHFQRQFRASLVAQMVKYLPAMWETWVRTLGQEESLEKEMAVHSSILAWKIPRRSLVGYRPWGRKESDTTERLHFHFHVHLYSSDFWEHLID